MIPSTPRAIRGRTVSGLSQVHGMTMRPRECASVTMVLSGSGWPDGSYGGLGTKAGANVMLEVTKDLKSISTNTGGQKG